MVDLYISMFIHIPGSHSFDRAHNLQIFRDNNIIIGPQKVP